MIGKHGHTLTLTALVLAVLAGAAQPAARAPLTPLVARSAPTTLIYVTTSEPDTLNPEITVENPSFDLLAGVFDTLVKVDPHDTFIPDLAMRWSVSADNLTYTFHLRRGVRWADGAPFTAADIAFTYRQMANPKNNNASTQGWDHVTAWRPRTPTQ